MTLDQAKFILQAYRTDQDTSDFPDLEEALELLEENAELQAWFQEEQAFDEAFASKLAAIDIPDALDSRILGQVVETSDRVVEFPWWRQFSVLGAVASMLLVLGLVLLPNKDNSLQNTAMNVQTFQSFANQSLKRANGFNARASDWSSLVKYLSENDTPAPEALPGKLKEMPPVGCMTLKFKNKPVGVVCFGKHSKSHIFVIKSEDFPRMPKEDRPVLDENPFTTTAYWSKNGRHYLLVSHDPKELKEFLSN